MNATKELTFSLLNRFQDKDRFGSAQRHAGISLKGFISGILFSFLYFLFQLSLFIVLRSRFKTIYQANVALKIYPESKAGYAKGKKSYKLLVFSFLKQIPDRILNPIGSFNPDERYGLDNYLFLRFLKLLISFFAILSIINIPILVPIHYFSMGNLEDSQDEHYQQTFTTTSELDKWTMSNLSQDSSNRLICHLFLSIFVVLWFHLILSSELRFVNQLGYSVLTKSKYQNILYLEGLSNELITEDVSLEAKFERLYPDCVDAIYFIPKDLRKVHNLEIKLNKLQKSKEQVIFEIFLEKYFKRISIQRHLITNHKSFFLSKLKNHLLFQYKRFIFLSQHRIAYYWAKFGLHWEKLKVFPLYHPKFTLNKETVLERKYKILDKKIRKEKLIKFRVNSLKTVPDIKSSPSAHSSPTTDIYMNKVFICFKSTLISNIIGEILSYKLPTQNLKVIIGPNIKDIIWRNILDSSPFWKSAKYFSANILRIFVIIGWILPVAFLGLISQIPNISSLIPFAKIIYFQSPFIREVAKNLIPIVTLIIIIEIVPYFFRWLSCLRGLKTGAQVEADVQNWYFIFVFIHLFLVVTISSGFSIIIERLLNNPVSIPALLANDLPKCANFFCSFVLIRGMAYAGGNLLRIKELLFELFYYKWKTCSPHAQFKRLKTSLFFQLGSIYPIFSVLGCIGIIYSVVAPIILLLCCISFSMVYFSFNYLFKYQYNIENYSETFGKLYVQALMQLYAGIYFMEFCLLGLFTLFDQYTLSTIMIVVFILTVMAHSKISKQIRSKPQHLPTLEYLSSLSSETKDQYYHESYSFDDIFSVRKGFDKIWLPRDKLGISEEEQSFLEKSYRLKFDLNMYSMDLFGDCHLDNGHLP
ncbi:Spo75p [Saccharomyces eubayanus]|uniref:Spo75p n=1 Tax=Saccharomyces eubayanus TaxID=1080349 RepID=UPI0006C3B5F2|nr:SPO75-like protein [Saccharomyces eubayanus]KOG97711.1 SPO75-like protein [Saccharomyces eubayanus]